MSNATASPASITTPTQPTPLSEILAARAAAIPVVSDAELDARAERERQRQADEINARKHTAWRELIGGVGSRYSECRLSNFKCDDERQTKAVQALHGYVDHFGENFKEGRGIVLYGPKGTGKDHLLTAMMRFAIGESKSVRWENGQDLFGAIRDQMDSDGSERSIIDRMGHADILAISDPLPVFGDLTSHQANMLFRILDRRYRMRRPVWVTMNVKNGEDAEKRMGGQLADRLRDGALAIHCNWPSYRKAATTPKETPSITSAGNGGY